MRIRQKDYIFRLIIDLTKSVFLFINECGIVEQARLLESQLLLLNYKTLALG